MQQFPATITPKAKGKQRSLGHNPGFFDQSSRPSGSAKGRPIRLEPGLSSSSVHHGSSAMPAGRERRILPIAKMWKGIRHPRSAKSNVREPQQTSSRSVSQERHDSSLGSIWTRIRHPQFHRTASTPPVVEVAAAQAKRRTIVSPPRQTTTAQPSSGAKANPNLQSASTQEGSTQASSDTRENYQAAAASRLPHEATARKDLAQSSRQAGRPGHEQHRIVIEDRESVGSGNVYAERDT
ncbi:hypothetical protein EDD22DRAFT_329215 [Suillus occidentalis]|nr:hypothetical protein EDD22DRAFT_329215 [Suillus occidentalis]